jgi:hypothetical protein
MTLRPTLAVFLLLAPAGCSSTYYSFWEKLGYEKRDIFVERVVDARDSQAAAKDQFVAALDRLQELTGFEGGELEAGYRKMERAYESCVTRAADVSDRIESVEDVADDLFEEWADEVEEISDRQLKAGSAELLAGTKARYADLIATMRASEAKMAPVLTSFKDQVLFLKANLNARAIGSLKDTALAVEDDVRVLIGEMEAAIREADEFVESIGAD